MKVLAAHLDLARRKKETVRKMKTINFVRAGEVGKITSATSGLLATSSDWKMQADIKEQLKFPAEIAITNQRPDIVLWSNSTKQIVMIELTFPCQERIIDTNEINRNKYQQLVGECSERGWKTSCCRLQRLCRTVSVANTEETRYHWKGKKQDHQ